MTPQRGKPHPPTKHEASAEVKAWKPLSEWPRSGQMPRTRKTVPNTESELFLHTPLPCHNPACHSSGPPVCALPSPSSCRQAERAPGYAIAAWPTKWPFRPLIFILLTEEESQYSSKESFFFFNIQAVGAE